MISWIWFWLFCPIFQARSAGHNIRKRALQYQPYLPSPTIAFPSRAPLGACRKFRPSFSDEFKIIDPSMAFVCVDRIIWGVAQDPSMAFVSVDAAPLSKLNHTVLYDAVCDKTTAHCIILYLLVTDYSLLYCVELYRPLYYNRYCTITYCIKMYYTAPCRLCRLVVLYLQYYKH